MSFYKVIAHPTDTVYLYDGSLDGFLCCVHTCIYERELPCAIWEESAAQPSLLVQKVIISEREKARAVRKSIGEKLSKEILRLVETVFLSCLKDKEMALLRFLIKAYREGTKVLNMLGHSEVGVILGAERHFFRERHLLLGFIRFSDYNGALAAVITPKNFVLPFLATHFIQRYPNENFMIYDKTHRAALVYQNGVKSIIPLEQLTLPPADDTEREYQRLWKQFYDTIAIEPRYNPRCRRTMMPKRYWENMTELSDEV